MKHDDPTTFEAAADLRRMLQGLGQDGPALLADASLESAREGRMAARIDAELSSLVSARRSSRRVWIGFTAAAALVALAFGVRDARPSGGSLAISAEPVARSGGGRQKRAEPVPPAPAALPLPPSHPPRAINAPSVAVPAAPAVSAEPQSTLAQENQLFKAAAEADKQGDVDAAVSRLDKLLAEHPQSPLAQTALVRKFRLLAKAGKVDEARREAERYLATYPTGFAVAEAQALRARSGEPAAP